MLINESMEMQNKENKITYTHLPQTNILEYFPVFTQYTEFYFLFFYNIVEIIVCYKSLTF